MIKMNLRINQEGYEQKNWKKMARITSEETKKKIINQPRLRDHLEFLISISPNFFFNLIKSINLIFPFFVINSWREYAPLLNDYSIIARAYRIKFIHLYRQTFNEYSNISVCKALWRQKKTTKNTALKLQFKLW